MATYIFDLNKEYSDRLENDALANNMNVQDYIRYKLFGEKNIFTVQEVIRRLESTDRFDSKEFTVPDVYTDEEWAMIDKGRAGVLGNNFYKYIIDNAQHGIYFVQGRSIKRRAVYFKVKK